MIRPAHRDPVEAAWTEWLDDAMRRSGRALAACDVVIPFDRSGTWRMEAELPDDSGPRHMTRLGRCGLDEAIGQFDRDMRPGDDPHADEAMLSAGFRLWRRIETATGPAARSAWSVLVHPLLAAACVGINPCRGGLPIGSQEAAMLPRWDGAPPGGMTVWIEDAAIVGTVELGECRLTASRTRVELKAEPVPQTMLSALHGASLGLLAAIRKTGFADVDDQVADLRIATAGSETDGTTTIVLQPVRWIPYAPPPDGWPAEVMGIGPVIA